MVIFLYATHIDKRMYKKSDSQGLPLHSKSFTWLYWGEDAEYKSVFIALYSIIFKTFPLVYDR